MSGDESLSTGNDARSRLYELVVRDDYRALQEYLGDALQLMEMQATRCDDESAPEAYVAERAIGLGVATGGTDSLNAIRDVVRSAREDEAAIFDAIAYLRTVHRLGDAAIAQHLGLDSARISYCLELLRDQAATEEERDLLRLRVNQPSDLPRRSLGQTITLELQVLLNMTMPPEQQVSTRELAVRILLQEGKTIDNRTLWVTMRRIYGVRSRIASSPEPR